MKNGGIFYILRDMKRLYLVRHGEAKPEGEDSDRSLSENGRAAVEKAAAYAVRARALVSQIRHSGKRRAEQTAEILAQHLNPAGGLGALPGLAPNDDVRPIGHLIERETKSLMLVGHLPFLSRLAGLLLIHDPERPFINLKTGSILCLEQVNGQWVLSWLYTPDPS